MSTFINPLPSNKSSLKKNKRKKIGSDEVPKGDIAKVRQGLQTLQTSAEDLACVKLNDGKIGDFEEVEELMNNISKVCQGVETYSKLCELSENEGFDVKSIPFSRMTKKVLETRLGVSPIEIQYSESGFEFLEKLISALQKHEGNEVRTSVQSIIDTVENRDLDSLVQSLHVIRSSVNLYREAHARIMIDQFILEAVCISSVLPNDFISILIPEFQISQLDSFSRTRIQHNQYVTYMSGSTDYAMWSVANGQFTEKHDTAMLTMDVTQTLLSEKFTSGERLMFYEAKREGIPLSEHLPQVIAQCVAMCSKLIRETNTPLLAAIPFCLTNGEAWIFGLVDNAYTCWVTPNAVGLEHPISVQATKIIMKTIMLWTLEPAHVLKNAIKELCGGVQR